MGRCSGRSGIAVSGSVASMMAVMDEDTYFAAGEIVTVRSVVACVLVVGSVLLILARDRGTRMRADQANPWRAAR
jgi:hypothetical protein